jgi:hypothetical protein
MDVVNNEEIQISTGSKTYRENDLRHRILLFRKAYSNCECKSIATVSTRSACDCVFLCAKEFGVGFGQIGRWQKRKLLGSIEGPKGYVKKNCVRAWKKENSKKVRKFDVKRLIRR